MLFTVDRIRNILRFVALRVDTLSYSVELGKRFPEVCLIVASNLQVFRITDLYIEDQGDSFS